MKYRIPIILFYFFSIIACKNEASEEKNEKKYFEIENNNLDTLIKVPTSDTLEIGDPFAFINQKGDTMISLNKFHHSFSDTIVTYGIVITKDDYEMIGINSKGQRLYEVYMFDNGPDYLSEGLFRIKRNGKVGFANEKGEIVIKPQFECASYFYEGKARVAYHCKKVRDLDEHTYEESDEWFEIDKYGKQIK